jgi:cation:H+ antiporter
VVRHGAALARRFGIHPIVIGMTVVSLGTSLPELAIGLNAARQGNGGLAVGNIVGTNLVNILLVLGLAALMRPVDFERHTLRFDLPAMVAAAVLLLVVSLDGSLSTLDGVWLCLYGAAYLAAVLARSRSVAGPGPAAPPAAGPPFRRSGPLLLVLGLAVTVAGSELLVDGAVRIARALQVGDAVIGLTVVAIGTSAPELVTTVVSTLRGDRAIALGNLLGSSVFNIALILGVTVLASPGAIDVPPEILAVDLTLMVAAAAVCLPAFWTRRQLSRAEGGAFVAAYVIYLVWLLAARL